jgi:hypothetical protein
MAGRCTCLAELGWKAGVNLASRGTAALATLLDAIFKRFVGCMKLRMANNFERDRDKVVFFVIATNLSQPIKIAMTQKKLIPALSGASTRPAPSKLFCKSSSKPS